MISKLQVILLNIAPIVCCLIIGAVLHDVIDDNENSAQVIQSPDTDEISLKQRETLNTGVLVWTHFGMGSGTIIDRLETDQEQVFEYLVLTNAHVIYSRFTKSLRNVNSLTGKSQIDIVDTGCGVITFYYPDTNWDKHKAKVVVEDKIYDLAILSFVSQKELDIAKMADLEMLKQVRVFDEVIAVGCQLGRSPSPTLGIISQIFTREYEDKERVIYMNTAQITPGSSGGGLFKKYDDHYYLIGVPYRISSTNSGGIMPHVAHAISSQTVGEFIDYNSAIYP